MTIFDHIHERRRWSEDELMVLEQVRRIAAERIAPAAAHYDESGAFPWPNVALVNELGLNSLFLPVAYGGTGTPFRLYLEVVKLIAAACASTGIIYATNYHAMKPVIDFATEEQKQRWLPIIAGGGLASLAITEPDAGSDATAMKTRFTPEGDQIIVDGGKIFITSGDVADLILLFGKWSEIADPKDAISVLVFEKGTPGFEVLRLEHKMGHRASSTASISFTECRVPRANLIGQPGQGLKILLASLNKSRPSVAAHALGIARAAFDDMVMYANGRKQSGRRIIDNQGIQFSIADCVADLAMAEVWLDHVAGMIDDGADDFGIESSIAKMRATDLAMRLTTEAVQIYGGYGYCSDYRVERLMRDAKITQIWEGTNQIHRQLVGRSFAAR